MSKGWKLKTWKRKNVNRKHVPLPYGGFYKQVPRDNYACGSGFFIYGLLIYDFGIRIEKEILSKPVGEE